MAMAEIEPGMSALPRCHYKTFQGLGSCGQLVGTMHPWRTPPLSQLVIIQYFATHAMTVTQVDALGNHTESTPVICVHHPSL